MMAGQTADANSYRKLHWDAIHWSQIEATVRRLQTRIVKALKKNAFRQVKNLQRLLTKSLSARLLAVKSVTTNKGRRVFEEVDKYVFQLLWQWAKRQHPTKSRKWIVNKYFRYGKRGKFAVRTKRGEIKEQYLASSTEDQTSHSHQGDSKPV